MKKLILVPGLALCCFQAVRAQVPATVDTAQIRIQDSIPSFKNKIPDPVTPEMKYRRFKCTAVGIAVPAAMVTYGLIALNNPSLKNLNHSTKSEILEDNPNFSTGIDNYMQYAPMAAVYVLNIAGVKGKHNLRDRTIILAMAQVLNNATVRILKKQTGEMRPDGSNDLSFPSGHTSNAFCGAEFLYQEYKDVSPWIGVAGYAVATATGAMRMYNNRHWLSDVVAGAGIGILSTKLAYLVYPVIQRRLFPEKNNLVVLPSYDAQWKSAGISVSLVGF